MRAGGGELSWEDSVLRPIPIEKPNVVPITPIKASGVEMNEQGLTASCSRRDASTSRGDASSSRGDASISRVDDRDTTPGAATD